MITNCQKQVLLHNNKSQYTVWSWDEAPEMRRRVRAHTPAPHPAGSVLGEYSSLVHWFQGCPQEEDILPTILWPVLDPWKPQGGRREPVHPGCPMTFTRGPCCVCVCTLIYNVVKKKRGLHMQSPSCAKHWGEACGTCPLFYICLILYNFEAPSSVPTLVGGNQHTMESPGVCGCEDALVSITEVISTWGWAIVGRSHLTKVWLEHYLTINITATFRQLSPLPTSPWQQWVTHREHKRPVHLKSWQCYCTMLAL